jgi:hypothetical protein
MQMSVHESASKWVTGARHSLQTSLSLNSSTTAILLPPADRQSNSSLANRAAAKYRLTAQLIFKPLLKIWQLPADILWSLDQEAVTRLEIQESEFYFRIRQHLHPVWSTRIFHCFRWGCAYVTAWLSSVQDKSVIVNPITQLRNHNESFLYFIKYSVYQKVYLIK